MLRKPVALLVTLFALGFALMAMSLVRWPTVMMAVSLGWREQGADLSGFDWRGLGLQFGAPALAAAVFLQISAFAILTRAHGAVTAFVFAVLTAAPMLAGIEASAVGTPGAVLVELLRPWLAGAAGLLLTAVWDLRAREMRPAPATQKTGSAASRPVLRRRPPIYVGVQRRLWAQQAARRRCAQNPEGVQDGHANAL